MFYVVRFVFHYCLPLKKKLSFHQGIKTNKIMQCAELIDCSDSIASSIVNLGFVKEAQKSQSISGDAS
jgi:hypothetical protein